MSKTFYIRNIAAQQDDDDFEDFQCRHIFPDGHRCGSPCLRNEALCYYHHTTRRPVEDPAARKARLGTFEFPGADQLSDRSGIQIAIAQVLERIASNDLDPRRAGLLLYGLQTAALTLPRVNPKAAAPIMVTEVVEDPELGTLATEGTIEELRPMGPAERLLKKLRAIDASADPEPHSQQHTQPDVVSTVLPTLHAVATRPSLSSILCPLSPAKRNRFAQQILPKPSQPLHLRLTTKPRHLPLRIIPVPLLRRRNRSGHRDVPTQHADGLRVPQRRQRAAAVAIPLAQHRRLRHQPTLEHRRRPCIDARIQRLALRSQHKLRDAIPGQRLAARLPLHRLRCAPRQSHLDTSYQLRCIVRMDRRSRLWIEPL